MPKTLIMDDDPGLEALCRKQAIKGAVDFVFARDDTEAIEALTSDKEIDIAVIATDRPGLNGMDLFRRLGGHGPRIPRIALIDGEDLAAIRRAMSDGAVDFLTRPVAPEELTATIDRVFRECEERRKAWRNEAQLAAIRREIDIASELQRRILPSEFPRRGDLDIFAMMTPAREMGGDFYDFFEIGADKLGLVVADVSGKGVPAAFIMAVARTLVRATAATAASPGECLSHANTMLCRHNIPGILVSVLYCVLDTATWEVTYANGGHMPPYLVRAGGGVEPLHGGEGVVLGVEEGLEYGESSLTMEPGDALFCYTDGLTEAFDPDRNQFSEQRLVEYLSGKGGLSARALAIGVSAFVNAFTGDAPQSDDITSLVVKRA